MEVNMLRIRAFADNPVTNWAKALLNLCVAVVAVLTLLMSVPILPPEVVAWLISIMAVLNTVIEFLKLLIPAPTA
jgi:hypothetical protein